MQRKDCEDNTSLINSLKVTRKAPLQVKRWIWHAVTEFLRRIEQQVQKASAKAKKTKTKTRRPKNKKTTKK